MGKRAWLDKLIASFVEEARDADAETLDRLCAEMRSAWAEHGLTSLVQQKNLMTEVRNAIKQQLGEDHPVRSVMNFSEAEWIEINHGIAAKAAEQNENQVILSPATVNTIVFRSTNLLQSRDWAEVAAGLVVLTGRRSSEVIQTAEFELRSDFSVMFKGALKRVGEQEELVFEIHTLCQAQYVIDALRRLRSKFPEIKGKSLTEVNALSTPVAAACEKHFADIVPAPAGRDNLYTHLFRKVNAAIATYFFCPPTVDDAEFRAEHHGHFAGHPGLSRAARRTIASDRHYRSYLVADADGAIRKGVKLHLPGVKPLDVFLPAETDTTTTAPAAEEIHVQSDELMKKNPASQTAKKTILKRPELSADDLDRMTALMAHRGVTGTYAQVFTALLDALDEKQENDQLKSGQNMESIRWFTSEIDSLRGRIAALEQERDELKAAQNESRSVDGLAEENAKLKAELDHANGLLAYFRKPFESGVITTQAAAPTSTPTVTAPAPVTATAAPEKTKVQKSTDPIALDPDVIRAVRAIIHHNDSVAKSPLEKWAISIPVLKVLLKPLGKASQPKIQAVVKAMEAEISAHHTHHLLGERHNRVHQNHLVTDYIAL